MSPSKIKSYLETATNIAVLSVSLLILSVFAWSFILQGSKPKFQGGLQKGKPAAALPGVDYSRSPQTLLIAMNSACSYCAESMPFYRRIAEVQRENKTTHVLAISTEAGDVLKQYLIQNQLALDAVPSVDFNAYRVASTPTIILVDRHGAILDFWIGKIPQDIEQQVLRALTTPQ